jgi:hypothetical protein
MKTFNALVVAMLGGLATFGVQSVYFPPQAHAAAFVVPQDPDWRQQMIARDPGGSIVDHMTARLTSKLDLSADQIGRVRPLLEQQHERILALLLTAPQSLTRDQFLAARHGIAERTHRQVDALLTPDQLELMRNLHSSSKA